MTITYTRSYHHELPVNHVCNDVDIQNLIEEIDNIRNDTTLARYENPTAIEMQAIFDRAATYTGDWYHSDILFDMDIEVSDTYRYLRQQILDLPAASGINASTRYDMPELEAILARGDFSDGER